MAICAQIESCSIVPRDSIYSTSPEINSAENSPDFMTLKMHFLRVSVKKVLIGSMIRPTLFVISVNALYWMRITYGLMQENVDCYIFPAFYAGQVLYVLSI